MDIPLTPRHLICTPDERYWKFNQPILFMNEWCFQYKQQRLWGYLDFKIAEPLFEKASDVKNALIEIRCIEKRLLLTLTSLLNSHHNTEKSERYWEILFGHWLRRYVEQVYFKTKMLQKIMRENPISSVTLSADTSIIAPYETGEWSVDLRNEKFNNTLNRNLIERIAPIEITLNYLVNENFVEENLGQDTASKVERFFSPKPFIRSLFNLTMSVQKYYISTTYLPKNLEYALNIFLFQLPASIVFERIRYESKVEENLRKDLAKQLTNNSIGEIEQVASSMLFDVFPICYLEGYLELNRAIRKYNWPKSPRAIFTSNDFDSNELFKLWTACKVEEGVPYLVGQHGNNYGVSYFMDPSVEEKTSDIFITWGWKAADKTVPMFNFKTAGKKVKKNYRESTLLLVGYALDNSSEVLTGMFSYSKYYKEQFLFYDSLQKNAKDATLVRLLQPSVFSEGNDIERWQEQYKEINLDASSKFEDLVAKSRLVVFSYDSTGILEMLNLNIPVIAFWQNGFDHVRDEAIPFYEDLLRVGIFHLNPESAAIKVNEVWNNLSDWWKSDSLQEARLKFCEQFSATRKYPIRDLRKILVKQKKA